MWVWALLSAHHSWLVPGSALWGGADGLALGLPCSDVSGDWVIEEGEAMSLPLSLSVSICPKWGGSLGDWLLLPGLSH